MDKKRIFSGLFFIQSILLTYPLKAATNTRPKTDLAITDLKVEPTNPVSSNNISLVFTVKNQGPVEARLAQNSLIAACSSFGELKATSEEVIASGASKIFRMQAAQLIPPGNYPWTVYLNFNNNSVPETTLNNNTKSINVLVNPSGAPGELVPDLLVEKCEFTPPQPKAGSNVSVKIFIKNQGTSPASYKADMPDWKITLPTLNITRHSSGSSTGRTVRAGESYWAVYPTLFSVTGGKAINSAGTYQVTVKADPANLIVEANENNNELVCPLTVVP